MIVASEMYRDPPLFKLTVPLFVNVPPPYNEPALQLTVVFELKEEAFVKLKLLFILIFDVPWTTIDFTNEETFMVIVLPVGIITSLAAVGTCAGFQLPALLNRSLTAPVHVMVWACIVLRDMQVKIRK
jgi:hypothetical protein